MAGAEKCGLQSAGHSGRKQRHNPRGPAPSGRPTFFHSSGCRPHTTANSERAMSGAPASSGHNRTCNPAACSACAHCARLASAAGRGGRGLGGPVRQRSGRAASEAAPYASHAARMPPPPMPLCHSLLCATTTRLSRKRGSAFTAGTCAQHSTAQHGVHRSLAFPDATQRIPSPLRPFRLWEVYFACLRPSCM